MSDSFLQKNRKRWRIYSWGGTVLVIGILAALNFIMSYVPLRLDTSEGRVYSLSRGSKELLKQLDDTLLIKVVYSSKLPAVYKLNEQYLRDLLAEYKRASRGKIRIEYFDPSKSPEAREEAVKLGVSPVQLDVRERDRREVKECFMGVSLQYGDRREALPVIQNTQGAEYEITVRIKKLVQPEKISIGVVQNGGALTFSDTGLQALGVYVSDLHTIETVDATQPIPAAIRSLWVIGPSRPFEKGVQDNIRAYVKRGGTLGLLLDRYNISPTAFQAQNQTMDADVLLEDWGLSLGKGLVVDPRCDRIQVQAVHGVFRMVNIVDYLYFPLSPDLSREHPASKDLDAVSFPFVSPVQVKEGRPDVKITPLARSSNMSVLEENPMDLNPLETRLTSPLALPGPFNLAVLAETSGPTPSRLIVIGTSRFIQADFPARNSNYGFFVNLVDWSVQNEALLQMRTKGFAQKPLRQMPDGLRLLTKYLMIGLLPLLSMGMGFFSWRQAGKRRARLALQYREA